LDGVLDQVAEREGCSFRVDLQGRGCTGEIDAHALSFHRSERAFHEVGRRNRVHVDGGISNEVEEHIREALQPLGAVDHASGLRSRWLGEILYEKLGMPLERRERVAELVRDDGGRPSELDEPALMTTGDGKLYLAAFCLPLTAGGAVIVDAHLYGAVAGALAALLLRWFAKPV